MAEVKVNVRNTVTGAGEVAKAGAGLEALGASGAKAAGGMNAAASASEILKAKQNALALASFQAQQASEKLAAAQKALAANTDPTKQTALQGEVLKAQVAMDKQTASATKLTNEIKKLEDVNDSGGGSVQKFSGSVQGAATQIGVALAAITAGVVAAKKVFDFGQEGAQLVFTQEKFQNLAASIGESSSSILANLQEVTKGTLTTAEQMDLASQIINLGLAKDEEGITRLANVVTNLGLDMQQVILTFANDSKMRLDALGLSITDVEERTKKYEEAGVAATEAFDLAVLDALEAKLGVVGSAADSAAGSYDRLTTAFQEATNRLKEQVGIGIEPAVSGLADYLTATNVVNQAVKEGILTATEANGIMLRVASTNLTATEVTETYTQVLQRQAAMEEEEVNIKQEMVRLVQSVADETHVAAWTNYQEYIPSIIEARLQQQAAINVHQETETTLQELALTERELTYTTNMAVDAGKDAAATFIEQKNAAVQLAEQQMKLASVTGDYFVAALEAEAGTGLYNEALDELGLQYVTVGGRTAEQSDELNRLQGIYNRASQTIQDYQQGLKGVGMEEDARNKKIEEQALIMQNAQAAMMPLLSIQGQMLETTVTATLNEEALNQAIFDTADKAGASATELAILGGALGLYSEQAVDAAIKSAAIQSEIDRLVQLAKEGAISWGSIKERVMDFANTLEEGFPPVDVDTTEAMDNINELAMAAEAAAGTYEVHYAITSDPIPDFPGGSQGGGGRDPNDIPSLAFGGYTGSGNVYGMAGYVHNDEMVLPSNVWRGGGDSVMSFLNNNAPNFNDSGASGDNSVSVVFSPQITVSGGGGDVIAQLQSALPRLATQVSQLIATETRKQRSARGYSG